VLGEGDVLARHLLSPLQMCFGCVTSYCLHLTILASLFGVLLSSFVRMIQYLPEENGVTSVTSTRRASNPSKRKRRLEKSEKHRYFLRNGNNHFLHSSTNGKFFDVLRSHHTSVSSCTLRFLRLRRFCWGLTGSDRR
ncbi:unnamed protein product, partial [Scytosiphon promiscuus]